MSLWRRRAREQHEAEAQAALANVAQHAQAGQRALIENTPWWSPPQMWSQTNTWAPPAVEPTPDLASLAAVTTLPEPVPAPPAPPTVDVSTELVRVLDVVTTMCDHVIEYIEADRAERRLMIEALTRLARSLGDAVAAPSASNSERVIGGSIPAGPDMIDIREDPPVVELGDRPVEVRCRFGDRWVDGFEICDIVNDSDGVRYRLRRRIDGVVLPELFDAADIRHVETFQQLTDTPQQQRSWSPL
jgi:hypothetical protein